MGVLGPVFLFSLEVPVRLTHMSGHCVSASSVFYSRTFSTFCFVFLLFNVTDVLEESRCLLEACPATGWSESVGLH